MKKTYITTLGLATCLALSAGVTVFTGCAGSRYQRSTGQYIDDKTLSYRVSSALHDNGEYKFDSVDVKAFRGNVQLSGFVNTDDQKKKAGEIAKGVQGVETVENNITAKSNLSQNQ